MNDTPVGQALSRITDHEYTWWKSGVVTRCAVEWEEGQYHRVGASTTVTPVPEWNATDFYEYRAIEFKVPFSFLPPGG